VKSNSGSAIAEHLGSAALVHAFRGTVRTSGGEPTRLDAVIFAAIDAGSNAVRLSVLRAYGGSALDIDPAQRGANSLRLGEAFVLLHRSARSFSEGIRKSFRHFQGSLWTNLGDAVPRGCPSLRARRATATTIRAYIKRKCGIFLSDQRMRKVAIGARSRAWRARPRSRLHAAFRDLRWRKPGDKPSSEPGRGGVARVVPYERFG